jgi:hypothetical protein
VEVILSQLKIVLLKGKENNLINNKTNEELFSALVGYSTILALVNIYFLFVNARFVQTLSS